MSRAAILGLVMLLAGCTQLETSQSDRQGPRTVSQPIEASRNSAQTEQPIIVTFHSSFADPTEPFQSDGPRISRTVAAVRDDTEIPPPSRADDPRMPVARQITSVLARRVKTAIHNRITKRHHPKNPSSHTEVTETETAVAQAQAQPYLLERIQAEPIVEPEATHLPPVPAPPAQQHEPEPEPTMIEPVAARIPVILPTPVPPLPPRSLKISVEEPLPAPPPLPPPPPLPVTEDVEVLPPISVELQPETEGVGATGSSTKVPISLDAVLRLAQDQNGEVAVARAKLAEAFAEETLVGMGWIPDLSVGGSFYRHDGGIQDFNGNLVRSHYGSLFGGLELRGKLDLRDFTYQKLNAARNTWHQRGELSKLTHERLLEATGIYIDLLAARSGEAVAGQLEKKLTQLLDDARKMEKLDPIARAEVVRTQTELEAQQVIKRKLREGANAAAAKLIYLLGLDPRTELVIMDKTLAPFHLVDITGPPEKLVDQVLAAGPGIQELEGLLGLIDDAMTCSRSAIRYMPTMELCLLEGGFGAGPGSTLRWDNRFDLGLHARWNLTNFLTRREKEQVNLSKVHQAQLTYQDLRAKLILAFFEAREVSLSTKEQLRIGEQQIASAEKAYQLSQERIVGKGKNPMEVLLAIRSIAGAQLSYITALREYDRAQLRLFILIGAASDPSQKVGVN